MISIIGQKRHQDLQKEWVFSDIHQFRQLEFKYFSIQICLKTHNMTSKILVILK